VNLLVSARLVDEPAAERNFDSRRDDVAADLLLAPPSGAARRSSCRKQASPRPCPESGKNRGRQGLGSVIPLALLDPSS
jgi:hypothetical protein